MVHHAMTWARADRRCDNVPPMMDDVWAFCRAILVHWGWLASGGIAAAISLIERFTKIFPLKIVALTFFGGFLLVAIFFAWRDEHRKAEDLAARLDDRINQQQRADEYAPIAKEGQKILIEWVDAISKKDEAVISKERARAFAWLVQVRDRLTAEFGVSVAQRFNLGKPQGSIIGRSEPLEHEARLVELDALMREMRDGRLPLRAAHRTTTR